VNTLKGFQKKYLRGLAHGLKPVVFIGQKGDSDSVLQATDAALNTHELIKVKFIDFKEKATKKEIIASLEQKAFCETVGVIGHMAIFYRQHRDPEKRKITLPKREC
jgi:RNA-binding protein